ncbi:MAG: hypothetical protein Q8Q20_03700 [bacterium]|nr:hypothetical protein [bacterium]
MRKLYLLGGIVIGGVAVVAYFLLFPPDKTDTTNISPDPASVGSENTNEVIENINTEPEIPDSGPLHDAARARDVRRMADIQSIYAAINDYHGVNGHYPSNMDQLVPDHLSGLPANPEPGGMDYVYTPIGIEPAQFFSLYYRFEVGVENIGAGDHEATPESLTSF